MHNKRGQYYLVAAIIIISILAGFIAIVNYAKKSGTVIVKEVGEELKIETQKVLEYDLGHSGETIRQYGKDYSKNIEDIELYFITGNDPNIKAYKYINNIETDVSENLTVNSAEDTITLELYGEDYEFDLGSGENLYYIILQNIKGERFVETG